MRCRRQPDCDSVVLQCGLRPARDLPSSLAWSSTDWGQHVLSSSQGDRWHKRFYFVILGPVGAAGVGAAGESENVSQTFQSDGRFAASNSP